MHWQTRPPEEGRGGGSVACDPWPHQNRQRRRAGGRHVAGRNSAHSVPDNRLGGASRITFSVAGSADMPPRRENVGTSRIPNCLFCFWQGPRHAGKGIEEWTRGRRRRRRDTATMRGGRPPARMPPALPPASSTPSNGKCPWVPRKHRRPQRPKTDRQTDRQTAKYITEIINASLRISGIIACSSTRAHPWRVWALDAASLPMTVL